MRRKRRDWHEVRWNRRKGQPGCFRITSASEILRIGTARAGLQGAGIFGGLRPKTGLPKPPDCSLGIVIWMVEGSTTGPL